MGVYRKGPEDLRVDRGPSPRRSAGVQTATRDRRHRSSARRRRTKPDTPATDYRRAALNRLGPNAVWLVENGDLILASATNVLIEIAGFQPRRCPGHAWTIPFEPRLLQVDRRFSARRDRVLRYGTRSHHCRPMRSNSASTVLSGSICSGVFRMPLLSPESGSSRPGPAVESSRCLISRLSAIKTLPPLPPNLTGLFALSVDLAKTYDQIDTLMKRIDPPVAPGRAEPRYPRSSWDRSPQGTSRTHRSPDCFLRASASRRSNGERGLTADVASRRLHGGRAGPRPGRGGTCDRFAGQVVQSHLARLFCAGFPGIGSLRRWRFSSSNDWPVRVRNMCWTCPRIRFPRPTRRCCGRPS